MGTTRNNKPKGERMIIHFISSSDDYFTINDLDYLMKEINNIMKNNVEL